MIRTVKDIVEAFDAGRVHSQRFFKNLGTTGDGQWHDWSFASGQPAYDARIGDALTFTPAIAAGNDAVFFPAKASDQERVILTLDVVTTPSGTGQTNVEFVLCDVLGWYPLIDGDSTDTQALDTLVSLPRYDGAQMVLVNHVAPALVASDMIVTYENQSGGTSVVTWRTVPIGHNKVSYTTALNGTSGPLFCQLAPGDTEARRVIDVTFPTAPGGLWAIYMVKPLTTFANRGGSPLITTTVADEHHFSFQNAFNLPRVKDGAWLGMFFMPNGAGRQVALHGNITFAWG